MKHLVIPILAAVATVLNTFPAFADLGDQLFKLLPDDGTQGDLFGLPVDISGTIAIVGAHLDNNENGSKAGSAYLFDTATGIQLTKLLPDDGAADDRFGRSVGIYGNIAIVGAAWDDDNGDGSGSAYLFDTTTGQQICKLLANDGDSFDFFGTSVAISGNIAIVGASNNDDFGTNSGSAYLFDTATGKQLFKLLPEDGGAFLDNFGTSVAISGNISIVSNYHDDDNGTDSGSAYLFDTKTGLQIAKLLPNDGAENDFFGTSVALNGDVAIVGASWDDDNGTQSGSAYLFDINTGQQIAKLLPNDGAELDFFGACVAISNSTIIIGAEDDDDNGNLSGSAYIFDLNSKNQIAKLLPRDGDEGDLFGASVSISGTGINGIAIAGAYFDEDNGFISGSAYLFDVTNIFACPWDLHGDGNVGLGDLLILLGWWCCDPNGPPDFNGDGIVNTIDLLELLANWGPCP